MKNILVITENKNIFRAFTNMLNKNISFKRISESPKESQLVNDKLKIHVVIKELDIDTFAYDEVLSLTRDGLAETQLHNIAEAFVKELSNKDNEETSQLIKIHSGEKVLNKEVSEKSRLEVENQLKSMKNDESEEKSENNYLNLNTEKVLDGHLIQLQMLNTYEKVYYPKELTHLLNSITNLDVLSKWNEEYQSILDEKLKDIQKFILNKIGYHLKLNEFKLVDGWTEVLIELESKMF